MGRSRNGRWLTGVGLMLILLAGISASIAWSIPVFSRKYQTSCSTCHYAFPQLNAFGKAFQANGYRYPGGDANFRKEDPVSLGSESYKKVWPNAIWPSDIPGTSPFAVHAVGSIEMPFNQPDSVAKSIISFPQHVQVFYTGALGERFSIFGEVEIEDDAGTAAVGFPFRFSYNQAPAFNVTVGSLHFDPTPGDFGLIPQEYNVSALPSRYGWTAGGEQPGIGAWGAGNGSGGKGGWKYSTGVVEGQGMGGLGADKDVFARASYKIGGLGEIGGTEGQASTSSAFYQDNSATIGGYIYSGKVAGDGTTTFYADREDLTAYAGTADLWYKGAILNATVFNMTSKIDGRGLPERKSLAWYVQGQYVIYPWLIGLTRYEATDEDTGDNVDAATTLIPAVVGMVRANVKLTLEYRRPMSDYSTRKVDEEHLLLRLNFAL